MAAQLVVDVAKKKYFVWAVSHISIFHPTLNCKDQINTALKRLETKLTYGVKDRNQLCSLP